MGSLLVRGGERIIWQAFGREKPRTPFAAEIMCSFTPRARYHANSYDAASHRRAGGKITFPIHEMSVVRRMTEHGPSQH